MIAHRLDVGKMKSMKVFYVESVHSLVNTTLDLNIVLVCEIFTAFLIRVYKRNSGYCNPFYSDLGWRLGF